MLLPQLLLLNSAIGTGQLEENWHHSLVTIAGSSNEEAFNQDSTYGQPGRQPTFDRDLTTLANSQYKPGMLQMQQQQQTLNLQVSNSRI